MVGSQKVLGLFVCISTLFGCSSDSGSRTVNNPCLRKELSACGQACDNGTKECGAGLYCDTDLTCAAECTADSAKTDCDDDKGCSEEGRCVVGGASGGGGTGGNTSAGNLGDAGGDPVCGEVKLAAVPKVPNVIVIVDQSSSMTRDFVGTESRWDVLKASLLAPDGLFAELQGLVRFGIVLYSGQVGEQDVCPHLSQVSVALNNLEAIRALYQPEAARHGTPTGESIEAVLNQIEKTDLVDPKNPAILVLATDGQPNSCKTPDVQDGQMASVDQVKRAFGLGIRTYVIAVGTELELPDVHVNDLASAGIGVATGAPSFRVDNDAALRAALRSVVGGELSCTVPLKGKVTAKDPCAGTVLLDGKPLECMGADGWVLVNPSTIELKGTACDGLKTGKKLEAKFECGDAIPEVI